MPIEPPVGWTNIGAVLKQAAERVIGSAPVRLDRDAAQALCRKLDAGAEQPQATAASAVAMRRIRVAVIGGLIDALAGYTDEELCTVTIVKPTWVFTPAQLSKVSARTIKRAFEQDLRRAGIAEIKGPFVGFLHGEYEPTNNVFVLHYHCTTTWRKAAYVVRRLRRLKRTYRAKGIVKRPIRVSKMKNRVGQLTYLFKRYWPSKPILLIDGKETRRRKPLRVPEPYSCAYLLRLDQQPFIDLTVSKGTSPRKHGSAAWSIILAELLLGGDPDRERWTTTRASFVAIDSLVHSNLHRTGILRRSTHGAMHRCRKATAAAIYWYASSRPFARIAYADMGDA